jgi:hypothetical protein
MELLRGLMGDSSRYDECLRVGKEELANIFLGDCWRITAVASIGRIPVEFNATMQGINYKLPII